MCIHHHPDEDCIEVYDDGNVYAELYTVDNGETACILEFTSHHAGKGNARHALQNMRRKYKSLSAQDIGSQDDPAYRFWMKMAGEGLLDRLFDDDLQLVFTTPAK